ncbi:hypothetical protein T12_13964 [Trichinella patagoniensis]|uniref:Uncharacterized protein n=1 Tax=Trichinella patagoniensis TaxID=990121 RepID=A0A0V1ABV0_9BILA|nr:hypothetical protein T12_13964 [Trichinella patagoniensis]
MEVLGGEGGEEVFSINPLGRGTQKFVYGQVGRVCWENRSKTKKPWKESAFTTESDNQVINQTYDSRFSRTAALMFSMK